VRRLEIWGTGVLLLLNPLVACTATERAGLSGVVALFAEGISALARQNEMLAAINAYNHDLVTGRLQN
jgi:hypothetical protein